MNDEFDMQKEAIVFSFTFIFQHVQYNRNQRWIMFKCVFPLNEHEIFR
jgi:hypothetical protein